MQQESGVAAAQVEAREVLAALQQLLLPPQDETSCRLGCVDDCLTARERLDALVYQVTAADQIRLMQSYFRDSHDDLCVCEALREPQARLPGSLPTKHLVQVVAEGRARVLALSKLVHGSASLATIKATTELASAYAIQSMWEQALAQAVKARERMEALEQLEKDSPELAQLVSREAVDEAADAVCALLSALRSYATNNAGTIDQRFLEHPDLQQVPEGQEVGDMLRRALRSNDCHRSKRNDSATADTIEFDIDPTALSWGQTIALLRRSDWLARRMQVMTNWLLPSWLAALRLAFAAADQDCRGLARPQALMSCLKMYPSPLRVTSSTEITSVLSQVQGRVEIPLRRPLYLDETLINVVTYDLPVTWEAFLACYVQELSLSMKDVVRYEISTMLGICCAYTERLMDAEAAFQEAIQLVDSMGIESDMLACDLYNSIAQLLLAKHKHTEVSKKLRSQEIAAAWLKTEEGKSAVQEYAQKHPHSNGSNTPRSTARSTDSMVSAAVATDNQQFSDVATRNAYRTLMHRHVKQVLRQEADASTGDLLAAYRYLMRSVDIQERICDHMQPAIASAAISVASIEYVRGRYEEARDWLVQSIRAYEREEAAGARGVAFVQVQLSYVFQKLQRWAEARNVLEAAVAFHNAAARQKASLFHQTQEAIIEQHRAPTAEEKTRLAAMERDFQEEAATTLQLQFRTAALNADQGESDKAVRTFEEAVDFAGFIFGWDSPEAADARRENAKLLVKLQEYGKARQQLESANDVYRLVYGPTDQRVAEVLAELKRLQHR